MSPSLFDIPAAAIDHAVLDAFLAQRLPESLNIDYKGALSDRVYETIAAMANTYGGFIFVGVDEDPNARELPLLPPVGVAASDRERLINQALTRLVPPFAFDVVPVALPEGDLVVLVVRVDSARAERPVVLTSRDSHRVLVRLDTRNAQADRYRMASLFAEDRASALARDLPSDWSLTSGAHYPVDDRQANVLTARISVEAAIRASRIEHAFIDTNSRQELVSALQTSPLDEWLSGRADRVVSLSHHGLDRWRSHGLNLSWIATLRWRAYFKNDGGQLPTGGQAALVLPAGMHAGSGKLALLLDVSYDPQAIANRTPRGPTRLGLVDLYYLLLALLDSAIDVVAPATFPRILGIPVWERIGPVCYLHAGPQGGLGQFLELGRFGPIQNPDLSGARFTVPRDFVLESRQERTQVVREWLTRLLLDMGSSSFEQDIEQL